MKNRKLFIGNISFTATEEEVKTLISQHGTIEKITHHKKKGYALVEMEDAAEAQNVINKLDGRKFKDRELRISLQVRPGTAKSLTKKRFQEKGLVIAKEKAARKKNNGQKTSKSGAFKKYYKKIDSED